MKFSTLRKLPAIRYAYNYIVQDIIFRQNILRLMCINRLSFRSMQTLQTPLNPPLYVLADVSATLVI